MKIPGIYAVLTVFVMSTFMAGGAVWAGDDKSEAIVKMAEIMTRLKHYPSPDGKQSLQQIISSSTSSKREQILATAMLNLNHKAIESDRPKLQSVVDDSTASVYEKQLASIILNLDHRPSKEDKEKLKAMMP